MDPSIKDEHGLRKTTKKKKKRGRGSTLDVQVIWAYTPSLSVDPKCKRERERERERDMTYKKSGPLKNLANTVHLPMAKKSVNNASKQ